MLGFLQLVFSVQWSAMEAAVRWIVAILFLCLVSCNSTHSVELNGFDQGKHTMIFEFKLKKQKLPDGTRGFVLDSRQKRGVGSTGVYEVKRRATLNGKWQLIQSESFVTVNDVVTQVQTKVTGNKAVIQKIGQKTETFEVDLEGPIYIEMHPQMYGTELTEPSTQKSYTVLNELDAVTQTVNVRFLGQKFMMLGTEEKQALFYQIEVVPTQWDDYYLDPDTLEILKIEFGQIQFLPKGVTP